MEMQLMALYVELCVTITMMELTKGTCTVVRLFLGHVIPVPSTQIDAQGFLSEIFDCADCISTSLKSNL